MLRTALLTAILSLAPARAGEATGDLRKMQGDWVVESYLDDGKERAVAARKGLRLSVKGDRSIPKVGTTTLTGTYALDESKKPRAIDITLTGGPDKGKKKLGIYAFKGDLLHFCLAPTGSPRRP